MMTCSPYAASNPFRFATKYTDIETGLVQYNLRYYSPSLGRFINRDPIEERGGLNLYAYVRNQVANKWDYIGLTVPDDIEDAQDDWTYNGKDISDGSLNGFFSGDFVGSMTGSSEMIDHSFWDKNTVALNNRGSSTGLTLDDLNPGGRLNSEGHDGPSLLGLVTGAVTRAKGVVLNTLMPTASRVASVSIGDAIAYDENTHGAYRTEETLAPVAPYVPGTVVENWHDKLTPEQAGRLAMAEYDRSSSTSVDQLTALQAAAREKFDNAVFQQPLTTLAAAGAQTATLVGVSYAVAAAPGAIPGAIAAGREYYRIGKVWVQVGAITFGTKAGDPTSVAKRYVQFTLGTRRPPAANVAVPPKAPAVLPPPQ